MFNKTGNTDGPVAITFYFGPLFLVPPQFQLTTETELTSTYYKKDKKTKR